MLEIALFIWSTDAAASDLAAVEHIFDVPVMQVDGSQLIDLVAELVAKFLNDEFKDLLDKIQVVHENLQKVLNLYLLMRLETKFDEITLKRLFVFGVVNECPSDLFDDSEDSLRLVLSIESGFLVVYVAFH